MDTIHGKEYNAPLDETHHRGTVASLKGYFIVIERSIIGMEYAKASPLNTFSQFICGKISLFAENFFTLHREKLCITKTCRK